MILPLLSHKIRILLSLIIGRNTTSESEETEYNRNHCKVKYVSIHFTCSNFDYSVLFCMIFHPVVLGYCTVRHGSLKLTHIYIFYFRRTVIHLMSITPTISTRKLPITSVHHIYRQNQTRSSSVTQTHVRMLCEVRPWFILLHLQMMSSA